MSLLPDARNKPQPAQSAQDGGCAAAGNTLAYRLRVRLALGGMILLLGIGTANYLYAAYTSNMTPLHPVSAPSSATIPQHSSAMTRPVPQSTLVPAIDAADSGDNLQQARPFDKHVLNKVERSTTNDQTMLAVSTPLRQAQDERSMPQNSPIRITRQQTEPIDPLLGDAYLAYRNGNLDEAQLLYLAMFKKDAHNPDVLLGLAAIAQQQGENMIAAQYYSLMLALDPRNALANAGMSALSTDDDANESRLKILLREQGNFAALHFALGNLYAGQSRWGEAQQAYFNAYMLDSANAGFIYNLAVSLDHLGQYNLAARHYQDALQLDQSNSAGFDHAQISQRIRDLRHLIP